MKKLPEEKINKNMMRLVYLVLLLSPLLCSCSGGGGFLEYWLTIFANSLEEHYSIEKDGLEGCDTVPLPGDKEQIAASFLANADTLWVQMRDSLTKYPEVNVGKYIMEEDFLYDPEVEYKLHTYYISEKETDFPIEDKRVFLPKRPSEFYYVWTDLILYSKDKLLCWAFIFIRQDEDKGGIRRPPYYKGLCVIGKRKSETEPFKIYMRGDLDYTFGQDGMSSIRSMENRFLYVPSAIPQTSDVYMIKDSKKLPALSDPDFFEKHPLFHKYNDSTYNFEWYDRGSDWRKKNKEDQEMYRYPY